MLRMVAAFLPFALAVELLLRTKAAYSVPLPETAYFRILPHTWTIEGYRKALGDYNFTRYMANSAILAASVRSAWMRPIDPFSEFVNHIAPSGPATICLGDWTRGSV